MNYLFLIAQLCIVPNGNSSGFLRDFNERRQTQCYAFYVQCVRKRPQSLSQDEMMESCILERDKELTK